MIKSDLINELARDKKYLEMEFVGLASNAVISYEEKIMRMKQALKDISVINNAFGLLDVYIPEPEQQEPQGEAPSEPSEPETQDMGTDMTETKEDVSPEESPFPKIN